MSFQIIEIYFVLLLYAILFFIVFHSFNIFIHPIVVNNENKIVTNPFVVFVKIQNINYNSDLF